MIQDVDADSRFFLSALTTAKNVALMAGNYLRGKQGTVQVVGSKALRDELLDADLGAETIILNVLQERFPAYDILSEERSIDRRNASSRWIVDPLDGSFNFQHGSPTFAVSIGMLVDGVMQVAVVHLPFLQETFTAIRGCGAYRNDERIHVSTTADLNRAIVHVGDFAKDGNRLENEARLLDMGRLANAVGRIRMIGTAATDLAYVACGRAEAFIVHNALPWDIQIGALLVEEAGGQVAFHPHAGGGHLALCSNEAIHQRLTCAILDSETDDLEPDFGYSAIYDESKSETSYR